MTKSNRIDLSSDRRELKIHGPYGQLSTLHSRRPGGFTEADLELARNYRFPGIERGQVNTARRLKVGHRVVYLHKSTGPPTWWIPQAKIRRDELMIGWLRLMVAVVVKQEDDDGQ